MSRVADTTCLSTGVSSDRLLACSISAAFSSICGAIGVGRIGHQRQALDEHAQHLAHFLLRLQRAALGLGLLEDHVAQPALDVVEPAQRQRRRGRRHQGFDLALEPAVVQAQLADVLHDQAQQMQQCGLDLDLVLGGKRHAVPEAC